MEGLNIEVNVKLNDSTVGEQLQVIQERLKNDGKKGVFSAFFDLDTYHAENKLKGITSGVEKLKKLLNETSGMEINPFRGVNTKELNNMLNILKQLNKYNQGISINFNSNITGFSKFTNEIEKGTEEIKSKIRSEDKEIARLIQSTLMNIGLPATSGKRNIYQEYYTKILTMPKEKREELIKEMASDISSLPRLAMNRAINGIGMDATFDDILMMVESKVLKLQEELAKYAKVYEQFRNVGLVQDHFEKNNIKDPNIEYIKQLKENVDREDRELTLLFAKSSELEKKKEELSNKKGTGKEGIGSLNSINESYAQVEDQLAKQAEKVSEMREHLQKEMSRVQEPLNIMPELMNNTLDYSSIVENSVAFTDDKGEDITKKCERMIKESKQLSQVLAQLKAEGTVAIKIDQINEETQKIERFSASVEKAGKIVENYKYRLSTLIEGNDDPNNSYYKLYKSSGVDKSDKVIKQYQSQLDSLRNSGMVKAKKIDEVQELLNGKENENGFKEIPYDEIKKQIGELSKEEKLAIANAKKDISEMTKLIDAQLKKVNELEQGFHSLQFIPNKKQDDINGIKKALEDAKEKIKNGEKVDKNTGVEILKTESLEAENLIKKIGSLSNAYDMANKKDIKEAKTRKALYEEIFNLQKKMEKQAEKLASSKTGDKGREVAQNEYDRLNEELKKKKADFNQNYFNKSISDEIKANDKEFDFKLLEQKAQEIDNVSSKLKSTMDSLKNKFSSVIDVNKIEGIKAKLEGLSPTEENLAQHIGDITKEVNGLEEVTKKANDQFKELQDIVKSKNDYTEKLDKLKDSKYLDKEKDIEPVSKKLETTTTEDGLKEIQKLYDNLVAKEKQSSQEAKQGLEERKKAYKEIFDIQKKMAEQKQILESSKTGDNSWIVADDRYKELDKEFNSKKEEFKKKHKNSGVNIDEELQTSQGELDFEKLQKKAKEVDDTVKKLTTTVEKMRKAFKDVDSGELDSILDDLSKLDPMSESVAENIVDITNKINNLNNELKSEDDTINKEKESISKLIELEKKRQAIREQAIKSSNGAEKDILRQQEQFYTDQIKNLESSVIGVDKTTGKYNSGLSTTGFNDDKAEELKNLREINALELQLTNSRVKGKELSEDIGYIYQKLNKIEEERFSIEKKKIGVTDEDLKKKLQERLDALKVYQSSFNAVLNKDNRRDSNKDDLLKLKKEKNNVDLDFIKANPSSLGNTDLEKFKKQQEQMLTNLEDKFKNILSNPEEIQGYIDELKKFNPALAEMETEMDKVIKKHKQLKEELQDRTRVNKLGEKVDGDLNLQSNIDDAEKYIKAITNGKGQITQFSGVLDQNGKKMRQIHYTMDEGKNRFSSWALTVDEATGSVYKLDKGITDITNRKQSFKDMLSGAFASVAGFTFISGAVMGVINGFKEAIKYTNEMDNAMTDLSKVVDLSKQQLDGMRDSALQLGEELGKSSLDIMKAMAEAGREFKNTSDITDFVRVNIMPLYIAIYR